MNFNELIQEISFETFDEVISMAPRKVRESLFSHYGVKNKNRGLLISLKDKKQDRTMSLHKALKLATKPRELEFLKELFRNWLFHQRPLLKSTLDYLKIENDNGLTEVETDFFKSLEEQQVKELVNMLKKDYNHDAILIYFTFMEVPFVNKYI